jgi:hypothetical protein
VGEAARRLFGWPAEPPVDPKPEQANETAKDSEN